MRHVAYLTVILLVGSVAVAPLAAGEPWREERFAPAVTPQLLWVGTFGAANDQWFDQVRIQHQSIQAIGGERRGSFGVQVPITADGSVGRIRVAGDPSQQMQVRTRWPDGGRVGPIQYGFNQVHAILQQPFMRGPGWELWGWNHGQANRTGNMADSRVRHAFEAPNRSIIAIGWTDGGNSSFRRDPRNIDEGLGDRMGIGNRETSGGGRGASSWVFQVTPQGELNQAMVFRGAINTAAWDAWGRTMVVGGGVFQPGSGAFADYGDGAGVVMVSRDWKRLLFKAHVAGSKPGADERADAQAWAVTIDSASGLAAVSGWVSGPMAVSDTDGLKPHQGRDAFLAIIRLWTPDAYTQAIQAEAQQGP